MTLSKQQLVAKATFEKVFWTWRGYKIQYTVIGRGQPLILIHGFGASIGHWRKNIPVLADAGYKVFAIDLLGFGASDKPILDYSQKLWVELLKDFWETHIQEPTIFVGNSIGGLLSLAVMAEHPEITAGGVLINCAGGLNHRPNELNLFLQFSIRSFIQLLRSPIIGTFLFDRIRHKDRIRRTLYQVYLNREAVTDELVELLHTPSCDPNAQQVFALILSAPPGVSSKELLAKVKSPLLVIWGADDPWTPINGVKIFQDALDHGQDIKIVPIPGAGHCPHDEVPELVNPQIVEWLKAH